VDHFRLKKTKSEAVLEDEVLENLSDENKTVYNLEVGNEMKNILGALRSLKDEYREVIIMHFIDELSIGEIAEVLGKSNGNVRVLLHRALTAARETVGH
jgi:RNA polymerase sigma-70 factor (ECF subfamily)